MHLKHLYLYGESYTKFKEYIKQIIGNVFRKLQFIYILINKYSLSLFPKNRHFHNLLINKKF